MTAGVSAHAMSAVTRRSAVRSAAPPVDRPSRTVRKKHPLYSYRAIDYWIRRGLVQAPMPGSGHKRVWDRRNLVKVHAMARLVRVGLTPTAAAYVAEMRLADIGLLPLGHGVSIELVPPGIGDLTDLCAFLGVPDPDMQEALDVD